MPSPPIHILAVDDEPDFCALTKEFLEAHGQMLVDTACSVKDARRSLEKNHYDAVVFDYQMPGVDGIQFLKSRRESGDTTPFILFTGKGRKEIIIEALNYGADSYMQKDGDPRVQFTELEHRIISLVRRHRAEEELRESEKKLQHAEAVAGFGHWQLDLNKMTIMGSRGTTLLCGLKESIFPLTEWQKIPLQEYRSYLDRALRDLIEAERPYVVEFELRKPSDGKIIDVYSLAEYDREKNVVFGVLQDVTERREFDRRVHRINRELLAIKECRQALVKDRTEQELLDDVCRIVCDSAGYRMAWIGLAEHDGALSVRPVAVGGFDQGYVAQIKATWGEDVRGWGPTGMSIKTRSTHFSQDFANDARTIPWRERALRNGYRSSIAIPLLDPSGAFGAFTLYSDKVNGFNEDEVKLLEELASDLSYGILSLRSQEEKRKVEEARKVIEQELQTTKARLEAILFQMPVGITVIEPPNGGIIYQNDEVAKLFRHELFPTQGIEEYEKWQVFNLDGTPVKAEDHMIRRSLLEGTVNRDRVEKILRGDGTFGYLSTTSAPVRDNKGNIIAAIAMNIDVTEQYQAQVELARSNAELTQFAFVASHDLQEPLRMVISYLTLLEKRSTNKLDADSREYIDFAVSGGKRMKALIDDLLAYSRVDTQGKRFTPVEMNSVVAKTLILLRASIEESNATVVVDPLPSVEADESQMVQLLQNLIVNAMKFHGASPPEIHVSVSSGHREWTFSVRDNGIGLDTKHSDRIFQMFQRLHTRDEYPGTGIGLAICKKIVERHGGRIWVESEEGKGATFFFTIVKRGRI